MRFSLLGLVVAIALYNESLPPALIPLGVVSQIIFSGIAAALGYDIGLILGLALKKSGVSKNISWPQNSKYLTLIVFGCIALFLTWSQLAKQQEYRDLLGIEAAAPFPLLIFGGTVCVTWALLRIGILIRTFAGFAANHVRMPAAKAFAHGIVWMGVAGLGYAIFSLSVVVLQVSLDISSRPQGTEMERPVSSLRSGGPDSLISWEGLGQKGQEFISRDARSLDTALFDKLPEKTMDPIRIYAGMGNEPGLERRVELIMKDLERVRAFERSAIVFFTPSGSGWVNPIAVEAVEHVTRGDSASVSLQYSDNQAIVQYIRDRKRPGKASALLFSKIRQRASLIPQEQRPKLYIYGESLGSLGSQQVFIKKPLEEITRDIDGALWVGSPASGPLWSLFGLPQVFGKSTADSAHRVVVRVGTRAEDLLEAPDSWGPSRVAFLYNVTDPVVWSVPHLAYRYPEWLKKPRSPQINEQARWWPALTFGHIWFELFSAKNMPSGIGHAYDMEIPCAMATVMQIGINEMCHNQS